MSHFLFITHAKKSYGQEFQGEAEVQIGFEDTQGVISFQVSSDYIEGFNPKAKNEAQKKQYRNSVTKLEENSKKMLSLSEGCSFQNVDLKSLSDSDSDSAHTDVVVEYSITCTQSVKGKKLGLNFQKFYSKIKKINVDLKSPSGSKRITLQGPSEVSL
jgi:hypothetical protein